MSNLYQAPAKPADTVPCPCGSGKTFGECCAPVLAGKRPAPSAEYLMRARYTAHCVGDQAFLHKSFIETRNTPFTEVPDPNPPKWTRLVIHSEEAGKTPNTATVDFSAYSAENEAEFAHHEKAAFEKFGEEWVFTKTLRLGPAPVKSAHPKVGRNDPCPCGSGKKYKHCCGKA